MKERPILFSAPMVRAILDGRKTQTRRAVKPQPVHMFGEGNHSNYEWRGGVFALDMYPKNSLILNHCPYGQPGDRLWVREAWSHDAESLEQCRASLEDAMGGGMYGPYYRATESAPDTLRWRPSIHMPRWASRIDLLITGVRVERLQDISTEDALAEGISRMECPDWHATTDFRALWESINGPGSWEANPWVWVIEFKRVQP